MRLKTFVHRSIQWGTAAALTLGVAVPGAFASSAPGPTAFAHPGSYIPAETPAAATALPGQNKVKNHVGSKKEILGPTDPSYNMDIFYDKNNHTITGSMSVTFKNNLDKTLNHVYFNLWDNAGVFTSNGGGITVSNVKVNGETATFDVNGVHLDISDLSLPKNRPVTVQMDFNISIPNQMDRFGWYNTTVSLGNWFPILAVYDDEGWNLDPYYPYGEAFYSLTSQFDVTVTTDKDEVIATTGREIGQPEIHDGLATHHYKAHQVRDFALEMSTDYMVKSAQVKNVDVNVYYTEAQAKYADSLLEAGKRSIRLFSEKFGKYAWPKLDIASMKGWFGGMEYPQLVMISIVGNPSQAWAKSVTAHEIGHQWFYGMVGDNEYDEPWLDESFAAFSAALFDGTLDQLNTAPPDEPYYHLSSSVSDFTAHASEGGIGAYYNTIYGYGSRTLNDLRELLGDEAFYDSIHQYFKKEKFEVSSTAEFIHIMEQASGQDLSEFFKNHRVYVSDQK
ncbi:MAG TPA: M1 family metallopeptidase [Bacillales bacterium]|nr:M1 family metallopeptidase [Bacillales bacterium]